MVLSIVGTEDGCTAYAVRSILRRSPSTHWSASAGAIYPLIGRLEAAELVSSKADPGDGRGRRLLYLTGAGRRAHREWMLRASSPEVAADVADAVRSRAFFLAALTSAEQCSFAEEVCEALEGYLEVARNDLARRDLDKDPLAYLAAKGGVYQANARVEWMREILAYVNRNG